SWASRPTSSSFCEVPLFLGRTSRKTVVNFTVSANCRPLTPRIFPSLDRRERSHESRDRFPLTRSELYVRAEPRGGPSGVRRGALSYRRGTTGPGVYRRGRPVVGGRARRAPSLGRGQRPPGGM